MADTAAQIFVTTVSTQISAHFMYLNGRHSWSSASPCCLLLAVGLQCVRPSSNTEKVQHTTNATVHSTLTFLISALRPLWPTSPHPQQTPSTILPSLGFCSFPSPFVPFCSFSKAAPPVCPVSLLGTTSSDMTTSSAWMTLDSCRDHLPPTASRIPDLPSRGKGPLQLPKTSVLDTQ